MYEDRIEKLKKSFEDAKEKYIKENDDLTNGWDGKALPLVRRVNNLVSPNLLKVEPLSGPSGLVYYFDYKYGTEEEQLRWKEEADTRERLKIEQKKREEDFDNFYEEQY